MSARRLLKSLLFSAISITACASEENPLFVEKCSVCHGSGGAGSDRGPALAGNRRLRTRSPRDIEDIITHGTPGGMPAIPLTPDQLGTLTSYIRSLNVTAYEARPEGDVAAGERFFFGRGDCAPCHATLGPDLSNVARQLTVPQLEQALTNPGGNTTSITLNNGAVLRGLARARGSHDVTLQTRDGQMHTLTDKEYKNIEAAPPSLMPALNATSRERADLIAWLSTLPKTGDPTSTTEPKEGDWPTYHGNLNGNRYSGLTQINAGNAAGLQLQWIYPIQYQPLEMTPLVVAGVMYVTGPNQVMALDAQSGREIWRYARPRTPAGVIAGDAALGANRGTGLSGDRLFFTTDNAHMLCLNRLTGALLWEIVMPESPQHYGATSAPLVVDDLVISGVAGGDEGIRGFIAAYKVKTGELAWRFWTVTDPVGGGSTWLTGTYDPDTGLLYWPTGNPYPDTDGTDRAGDNLYSNCDIALDPKTGKLKWYFQFTPHDLHDWDAVQPPVLVDAKFKGRERKLLLHANRNGYFYVLDRTDGTFLQATSFVRKLTWSSGIDAQGHPLLTPNNETKPADTKTCPAVRGATNWYSPAYSPQTNLYYVMAVEDCGTYRRAKQGGFGFLNDPKDPGMKFLRALNIETGGVAWEIPQIGPVDRNYSGVLATAGGLVFYGETSGAFAAVDAKTSATLWHFETGDRFKSSPMTYMVNGRQYVEIAAGSNVLVFALPAL